MKPRALPADPRTWLSALSVIILLAGLGSALLIYWAAATDSGNDSGYADGDGAPRPDDSKKYLRDMELYGGKANVLATELRVWVAGLWQGQSLAYTVAFITVLVSFGVYYCARRLPPRPGGGVRRKDDRT